MLARQRFCPAWLRWVDLTGAARIYYARHLPPPLTHFIFVAADLPDAKLLLLVFGSQTGKPTCYRHQRPGELLDEEIPAKEPTNDRLPAHFLTATRLAKPHLENARQPIPQCRHRFGREGGELVYNWRTGHLQVSPPVNRQNNPSRRDDDFCRCSRAMKNRAHRKC